MVNFPTAVALLVGTMLGLSISYLVDWMESEDIIRSEIIELSESDVEKIITKEVDDYGRLSVGTDLAGERVRVYISGADEEEGET